MNQPANDNKGKSWHDNLPFPKHGLGYMALKFILVAVAVYIVLRLNRLL